MTTIDYSRRAGHLLRLMAPINDFFLKSPVALKWAQRAGEPDSCDFMLGNPQEAPLPGFTAALQQWTSPQNKDWFAYKENEPASRAVVGRGGR